MITPSRHCDQCAFHRWDQSKLNRLICLKGHRPRFYLPASDPSCNNWGYKRRCEDFQQFGGGVVRP